MMKKLFTLLFFSAIICLKGAAEESTLHELNIQDFTELKVIEGINVNYVCNPDSAGKAIFTSSNKYASMLIFNNKNSKLEIQLTTNGSSHQDLPTVTVFSRFLSKVENSGDSTIIVYKTAPCSNFKARVIGNGKIIIRDIDVANFDGSIDTGNGQLIVSGACQNAKLSNTGTGTIQADELKSDNTNCRMLGTGTIGCNTNKTLNVSGASSGKVYYKGTPQKIKNRSIGIKIIPLDN